MRFFNCLLGFCTLLFSCSSPVIDGYTDKISYTDTDSISIFINSKKEINKFDLTINDLQGNSVKTIQSSVFPQKMQSDKPYQNGFGYKETVRIKNPKLKSGVYLIDNKIPFVVKSSKQCDILIVYSSNTENAYCSNGGKSGYDYNSSQNKPSPILSFNRPMDLAVHSDEFLRWIATFKNYNIGYISDQDLDDYETIAKAKLLIIPGHSEYWTRKARENFDLFINSGKNALILSGNTMWWQVRYDLVNNQMICYKDAIKDPEPTVSLKTINWTESSLNYSTFSSIGLDFLHGGYGKEEDKGWDGYKIQNSESPLLNGTRLKKNDILKLETDEYDGAPLKISNNARNVHLENPLNFFKYELIGFDRSTGNENANGSWIVMQKSKYSGIIINTGSTDWCRISGMKGKDSEIIKKITINMIDLLLQQDKSKLFRNK